MRCIYSFLLMTGLNSLFIAQSLAGNAIFTVTPSQTTVSVTTVCPASVNWTVTNNSSIAISNLAINPLHSGVTIISSTCSGALAPNASCGFTTSISGANQPANFIISPQICGFNNCIVASQPVSTERLQVTVINGPAQASLGCMH